jgi:predicted  nucleic acid-binding Zn-ribbon protein
MLGAVPGRRFSDNSVKLLKVFLERKAEELTIHASRIHDRENAMRDQLGEAHKKTLTCEHLKMAIDGKFSSSQGDRDVSEH